MAIPFHQERQDFELRKIHEALQPAEVPSQRDDAIGGPLVASEAEAPRTRRFRAELQRVDADAVAILLGGLALIVCATLVLS